MTNADPVSLPQIEEVAARSISIAAHLEGPVLKIVLGRGDSAPIMSQTMFAELGNLFDATAMDDRVRVVVLYGHRGRFSMGGNVRQMAVRDPKAMMSRSSSISCIARMYRNLLMIDAPVIAAVSGDAIGAGATLAFHSDVVLAADGVRFGDPHVNRGLVASAGPYVWPNGTSLQAAKYYLLTGELMPAEKARELGLVHEIYPADQLDAAVDDVVRRLVELPQYAVGWTKRLLNRETARRQLDLMYEGIALETLTFQTEDHREGVAAFLEKRPPRFVGA
jgi:enoyl-CoA hydratase